MRKTTLFTTLLLLPLSACDPEPWTPKPVTTAGSASGPGPETTGGDDSGGEDATGSSTDLDLCEASCKTEVSCFGEEPGSDCVEYCLENLYAFGDEACNQVMRDYTTCLAEATTCSPPCIESTSQAVFDCEVQASNVCSAYSNGQPGPACSQGESCEFDGGALIREFICEGLSCACYENGEEIASCEVDACQDPPVVLTNLWSEHAQACCGWSDEG